MNNVVADTYVEQQSFAFSINVANDGSTPPPSTHPGPSQSWAALGVGAMGVATVSGSLGYAVSIDFQSQC
jgi:hypothetical protein